jgi:hypothetical protein
MAGEAFRGFRFGIGSSFAKDKDAHTFFAAFFDVGLPWTMARLTPVLVGRAVGYRLLRVIRFGVAGIAIFMAGFADFHADNAIISPCLCCGKSSP